MTETTKEKRERVRRNLRRDEEEYEEQGATAAARDAAALGKRMDELTGIGHDEAVVSTFSLTRTLRDNDHRVLELTEKKSATNLVPSQRIRRGWRTGRE